LHCSAVGALLAVFLSAVTLASVQRRSVAERDPPAGTLTGIDLLRRDGFALLKGCRVGLITNHTGVAAGGVPTSELLHRALGVTLVALFSPEHGVAGKLDQPRVEDGRDPGTGVPVYSLYGATRRPTREQLRDLDTLVFDIQDIGTRFYTYISTMGEAMQAAAEHGVRFVVLDRPNPIGGDVVAGPVLDAGKESFVGFHTIPVRHGMTVGELALMFKAERKLSLDLHVVRVEGWRRADRFDATGLEWTDPSPNMRSLTAALLYPGVGMVETTNLSVGRGTGTPFEVIGAPWLDGRGLAAELRQANLPGVSFVPIRFTPESSKYQGQLCGGVRILVTDWTQCDPVRLSLTLAVTLQRLYPDTWDVSAYNRLLACDQVLGAVREGKSVAEIESLYQGDLAAFLKRREPFLLYR